MAQAQTQAQVIAQLRTTCVTWQSQSLDLCEPQFTYLLTGEQNLSLKAKIKLHSTCSSLSKAKLSGWLLAEAGMVTH